MAEISALTPRTGDLRTATGRVAPGSPSAGSGRAHIAPVVPLHRTGDHAGAGSRRPAVVAVFIRALARMREFAVAEGPPPCPPPPPDRAPRPEPTWFARLPDDAA